MLCHPFDLAVPNAKRGERNKKWMTHPDFSSAQKTAEMLINSEFSGVPNAKRKDPNQKWLPHRCLLPCRKKRVEMLHQPYILGCSQPQHIPKTDHLKNQWPRTT